MPISSINSKNEHSPTLFPDLTQAISFEGRKYELVDAYGNSYLSDQILDKVKSILNKHKNKITDLKQVKLTKNKLIVNNELVSKINSRLFDNTSLSSTKHVLFFVEQKEKSDNKQSGSESTKEQIEGKSSSKTQSFVESLSHPECFAQETVVDIPDLVNSTYQNFRGMVEQFADVISHIDAPQVFTNWRPITLEQIKMGVKNKLKSEKLNILLIIQESFKNEEHAKACKKTIKSFSTKISNIEFVPALLVEFRKIKEEIERLYKEDIKQYYANNIDFSNVTENYLSSIVEDELPSSCSALSNKIEELFSVAREEIGKMVEEPVESSIFDDMAGRIQGIYQDMKDVFKTWIQSIFRRQIEAVKIELKDAKNYIGNNTTENAAYINKYYGNLAQKSIDVVLSILSNLPAEISHAVKKNIEKMSKSEMIVANYLDKHLELDVDTMMENISNLEPEDERRQIVEEMLKTMTPRQLFVQEVLKGAYVQINDNGATYEQWKENLSATVRWSSHVADDLEFAVRGPVVKELLFCKKFKDRSKKQEGGYYSWFQLERYPAEFIYNLPHVWCWAVYKWTHKNQGPYGSTIFKESFPLICKDLKKLDNNVTSA